MMLSSETATLPGTQGRPSPRFALMEQYDIYSWEHDDELYLRRWRIIETPWFGIYLHHILLPDSDRAFHDHPYNFVALVLAGGYIEHSRTVNSGVVHQRKYRRFSLNVKRAEMQHRIHGLLNPSGTWTLLVHGRRRRLWGFSEVAGAWQESSAYIQEHRQAS